MWTAELLTAGESHRVSSRLRSATGRDVIHDGIQVARSADVSVENEVGTGRRDEIRTTRFRTGLPECKIIVPVQRVHAVFLARSSTGRTNVGGRIGVSVRLRHVELPELFGVVREKHVRFELQTGQRIRPVRFTGGTGTGGVAQHEHVLTPRVTETGDEL